MEQGERLMPAVETPKKPPVPARNALPATPLSRESARLDGQDPSLHYEFFSTDPSHPSYIGRKLRRHEIGDEQVGYAVCEAWEVVNRDNDPGLKFQNNRDDQGKPVDTTWRHGDMILCKTTKENAAKYPAVHDARVKLNSREMTEGATESFGSGVSTKAIVVNDDQANIDSALKGIR